MEGIQQSFHMLEYQGPTNQLGKHDQFREESLVPGIPEFHKTSKLTHLDLESWRDQNQSSR